MRRTKRSGSQASRALTARRNDRFVPVLQTPNGDFKSADALLPGDRRLAAASNRAAERLQFRAQRLGMADGEVPHRITAVRLEAKALRHLPREQVASDVFVFGRDGDAARF